MWYSRANEHICPKNQKFWSIIHWHFFSCFTPFYHKLVSILGRFASLPISLIVTNYFETFIDRWSFYKNQSPLSLYHFLLWTRRRRFIFFSLTRTSMDCFEQKLIGTTVVFPLSNSICKSSWDHQDRRVSTLLELSKGLMLQHIHWKRNRDSFRS